MGEAEEALGLLEEENLGREGTQALQLLEAQEAMGQFEKQLITPGKVGKGIAGFAKGVAQAIFPYPWLQPPLKPPVLTKKGIVVPREVGFGIEALALGGGPLVFPKRFPSAQFAEEVVTPGLVSRTEPSGVAITRAPGLVGRTEATPADVLIPRAAGFQETASPLPFNPIDDLVEQLVNKAPEFRLYEREVVKGGHILRKALKKDIEIIRVPSVVKEQLDSEIIAARAHEIMTGGRTTETSKLLTAAQETIEGFPQPTMEKIARILEERGYRDAPLETQARAVEYLKRDQIPPAYHAEAPPPPPKGDIAYRQEKFYPRTTLPTKTPIEAVSGELLVSRVRGLESFEIKPPVPLKLPRSDIKLDKDYTSASEFWKQQADWEDIVAMKAGKEVRRNLTSEQATQKKPISKLRTPIPATANDSAAREIVNLGFKHEDITRDVSKNLANRIEALYKEFKIKKNDIRLVDKLLDSDYGPQLAGNLPPNLQKAYQAKKALYDEFADLLKIPREDRVTNYFTRYRAFENFNVAEKRLIATQEEGGYIPLWTEQRLPEARPFFLKGRKIDAPADPSTYGKLDNIYVRLTAEKIARDEVMPRINELLPRVKSETTEYMANFLNLAFGTPGFKRMGPQWLQKFENAVVRSQLQAKLAGNIIAGVINTGQFFTHALPKLGLSNWAGGLRDLANPESRKLVMDAWRKQHLGGLQNVKGLEGVTGGISGVEEGLLLPMTATEGGMRIAVFAGGLRKFLKKGFSPERAAYEANNLVNETMFRFGRLARPPALQFPGGGLIYQFKSYPWETAQMFMNLSPGQKAAFLGTSLAIYGVEAIPGVKDVLSLPKVREHLQLPEWVRSGGPGLLGLNLGAMGGIFNVPDVDFLSETILGPGVAATKDTFKAFTLWRDINNGVTDPERILEVKRLLLRGFAPAGVQLNRIYRNLPAVLGEGEVFARGQLYERLTQSDAIAGMIGVPTARRRIKLQLHEDLHKILAIDRTTSLEYNRLLGQNKDEEALACEQKGVEDIGTILKAWQINPKLLLTRDEALILGEELRKDRPSILEGLDPVTRSRIQKSISWAEKQGATWFERRIETLPGHLEEVGPSLLELYKPFLKK